MKYGRNARTIRRAAVWTVGGLAFLTLGWIVVTGLLAKNTLSELQDKLQRAKALTAVGDVPGARQAAANIPELASHAHDLTSGPAWWSAASIPYLGEPFTVLRDTTAAVEQLGTQAVPKLLDVSSRIDPNQLRAGGSTVRVDPLKAASPELRVVARDLIASYQQIAASPANTWLPFVNSGRTQLLNQLSSVRGYVDAAARVADVLPVMLGSNNLQRYFVGLQNNAELRGTGGLPGAFAILEARDGVIRFTRFEKDSVLLPPSSGLRVPTGLSFGAQYDALYGANDPTASYVDSNVSPNFLYAAQIWSAMYEKVSGQHIDGAMALDPAVLGSFLAVTGPVAIPGGPVLSSTNIVDLTERLAYQQYPDYQQRSEFLVAVLRASSRKIISGAGSGVNLLRAASAASKQQRLLVWSRDQAVEKALEETNFAGTLPQDDGPLAALILNNAAAGKLDYYLQRSLEYVRTGCGSARDVLATITLVNNAPASGLPAYVTTRLDADQPNGVRPGDNRTLLDFYATPGATLQSVTLNGVPTTAATLADLGHPVFRLDVELPRGTSQTIVLHLREPAGRGAPIIWTQPGVTDLNVQRFDQVC